MNNHQNQEINAKFAQISKKPKLKPKFQHIQGEELLIKFLFGAGIILSPIIIITSPLWISMFIKDIIGQTILEYKCSNIQKEIMRQKEIMLIEIRKNQIIGQKLENINQTYPVVISKHKSKQYQFMWLINKINKINKKNSKPNIKYWGEITKQFNDRKKLKKQSTESMFFFAGTQLLNKNFTIEDIYNKWKSQNNILYIRYEVIEVFG